MKEIALITTGWFPDGDAGAVRLRMMSRCLTDAGYHVTVLCRGKLNDKGTVDGTDYISLRKHSSRLGKALDYYGFSSNVKKYLKKHRNNLHGIYIYNARISLFEFCKVFCKKNGIKLFHDCVEWYSPEEFKTGASDVRYRNKLKINTEVIDKTFSVIAISRYLEDHFKSKGIKTLRVPILCDSESRTEHKSQNGEKLTLFYAGLPGKKDLVKNLLEASLLLTKEEQEKLRIIFVGVKREGLIGDSEISPEVLDKCSSYLELCGRVSREEVLERMEEADFSVLIRNNSHLFARAGFPSKVTEALANATPMLANFSSDLEEYLEDGKNAIVIDGHTPEAVAEALRRAISLTPEEKNAMSRNALETARVKFDYRLYINKMSEFFE